MTEKKTENIYLTSNAKTTRDESSPLRPPSCLSPGRGELVSRISQIMLFCSCEELVLVVMLLVFTTAYAYSLRLCPGEKPALKERCISPLFSKMLDRVEAN